MQAASLLAELQAQSGRRLQQFHSVSSSATSTPSGAAQLEQEAQTTPVDCRACCRPDLMHERQWRADVQQQPRI